MVGPTAQPAASVSGSPALSACAPQAISGPGRGRRNGPRVSRHGDRRLDALQAPERKQTGPRETISFPAAAGRTELGSVCALAFSVDGDSQPVAGRYAGGRRPAPVGPGRVPERTHGFQQSSLSPALAAT